MCYYNYLVIYWIFAMSELPDSKEICTVVDQTLKGQQKCDAFGFWIYHLSISKGTRFYFFLFVFLLLTVFSLPLNGIVAYVRIYHMTHIFFYIPSQKGLSLQAMSLVLFFCKIRYIVSDCRVTDLIPQISESTAWQLRRQPLYHGFTQTQIVPFVVEVKIESE